MTAQQYQQYGAGHTRIHTKLAVHSMFTYTVGRGERGPEAYFRVPPNQNSDSDPVLMDLAGPVHPQSNP